ncbi:RNA methyltransferase [Candidatus Sulfidibacterium hydrothermale]|uniref:TrmH family RNA methyltransferase n=1 Tax=Candidatus Sulfidibacterium hydrothermale TaxID=2875962 RepID=UPI001F0AAB86|nr:RNA methyltransferase [Candidatus Sulfidibacterium hydrothermale]UBM61506.1 RNA methyltransferase [Candidatus Sulfidibacterium hydrothermale]
MDYQTKKDFYQYLCEYLTENRKKLFDRVIQYRTRHITVVLEDIYQPHNASAVLRSADLTGVQDIHIIENRNTYQVNPEVAMGSSKWLDLKKYNQAENNTPVAYEALRKAGYRIVATTPHKNDQTLDEISLDGKIALVFGTELKGLSPIAIEQADEYLRIPMYGFTESYNISVSAALVLFTLTEKLRKSDIPWQIPEEEKLDIKIEWAKRTIKHADLFEKEFLQNRKRTTSF